MSLEADSEGNIVIQPIVDWAVWAVEVESAIVLALEYVKNPAQLETGRHLRLQGMLLPEQAVELGEKLIILGERLLRDQPPPGPTVQ
jgi:hypothetical protein